MQLSPWLYAIYIVMMCCYSNHTYYVLMQIKINALLQRAHIFIDAMETGKAQEECDKAIELNSNYGDIHVQMAKVQQLLW